jgi:NADH-quinone oxidoreductase subunit L
MTLGPEHLWIMPLLPLLAAALLAFTSNRRVATVASIGAIFGSFILALLAFAGTLQNHAPQIWNFTWFQYGSARLPFGFLLDPLTGCMLVMVTFIALLIFIYSTAYMAEDRNYAKFFCFMSLFAGGMLGVVISNSLLLLFFCWEIVGLASYLLIGFWFFKPSAALAARKAFITTRVGDVGFFIGMIWLQSSTGTLLFYDRGAGCLESGAMGKLVADLTIVGLPAASAIALLIFCGAMGKSGQFPLHVWLPDAMEGPTPVSALIHAATMVAAGVFLVARVYPLMDADPLNLPHLSAPLEVITWVGAITAVFAACIAVAQDDIKRILAYSTISQLGYMMIGLGVGGVFIGMFHLITHAFFKALLFLGSGSVIHGCHGEQDIRKMGGLRKTMPWTFATYAVGMMALSGVPLFFSGFWSKDEILHSAFIWPASEIPFLLGMVGAFLTAFYMTRQVVYVFYGSNRPPKQAHESPRSMTIPLVILAACAVLIGFIQTPLWPGFERYLSAAPVLSESAAGFSWLLLGLMAASSVIVLAAIFAGWKIYSKAAAQTSLGEDPLQIAAPGIFRALKNRLFIDEFYEFTVIRWTRELARSIAACDSKCFGLAGQVTALIALAFGWLARLFDRFIVDFGFDQSCRGFHAGAGLGARVQNGKVQTYLRAAAIALSILVLFLAWGWRSG